MPLRVPNVGPVGQSQVFLIFDAVAAVLIGNQDRALDAVAKMDIDAARVIWSALEEVQGLIEDADGGAEGRPWD